MKKTGRKNRRRIRIRGNLPLVERKALLDEVIQENDTFARIRFVEGNATGLFQATGDAGLEGIVIAQSIKTHEDRWIVYLEPRIRCRVKYKKRTHAGFLRETVFQGFVL